MDNLRDNINSIDNEILNLLKKRMEISKQIGKYKKDNNLPIFDSKRELLLIERLKKINKETDNQINEDFIEEFWNNIMFYSKKLQE